MANEFAFLLGAKEVRQPAMQAQQQGQRLLGDLIAQHARGAGDDDLRGDDRGDQAMVEPGRRRLNPLQPAAADDRVPIDRHLGMAAKDIGLGQFPRDVLLPGVDDFGPRRGRLNLCDVFRLDRIAKNDAHGRIAGAWAAGVIDPLGRRLVGDSKQTTFPVGQ